MKFLRKLLFPFSLLYGGIAALRNFLYAHGVFKAYTFAMPVIVVGNLSTGGTGKTPHTEYLVRILSGKFHVAILSRGYRRRSSGFILAGKRTTVAEIGDEPFQYHSKFDGVDVAVDSNRKNGIEQLISAVNPDVILLDDAYQHRRVKAGFYILLTAYGDLYADDLVLPAGNLREFAAGARRADVIIVTKCPSTLTVGAQQEIIRKLKPRHSQPVFFTTVAYDENVYGINGSIARDSLTEKKILVAGIAKPEPFFRYLQRDGDELQTYPDHHDFTEAEVAQLESASQEKIIITTEKDYMRLKGRLPEDRLFYLPIRVKFLNGKDQFDKLIADYVGKSTRNS